MAGGLAVAFSEKPVLAHQFFYPLDLVLRDFGIMRLTFFDIQISDGTEEDLLRFFTVETNRENFAGYTPSFTIIEQGTYLNFCGSRY